MIWERMRDSARALVCVLLLASALPAQVQPGGQTPAGSPLGPRVSPKPKEICVVCNQPVGPDDDVYLVNGQRMPVHRAVCLAKLESNPERYKARLRPAGNFLGVEPDAAPALTSRWLALGLYVLLGLVFSAVCANAALNAGLRPAPWFYAGLFLNVIAWAALMARRRQQASGAPKGLAKIPETAAPLPCPACGRLNHPSAAMCLGCGARLEPEMVSEASRAGLGRRLSS